MLKTTYEQYRVAQCQDFCEIGKALRAKSCEAQTGALSSI